MRNAIVAFFIKEDHRIISCKSDQPTFMWLLKSQNVKQTIHRQRNYQRIRNCSSGRNEPENVN